MSFDPKDDSLTTLLMVNLGWSVISFQQFSIHLKDVFELVYSSDRLKACYFSVF